jgi:DNA-binding SARP family transcriptional activator
MRRLMDATASAFEESRITLTLIRDFELRDGNVPVVLPVTSQRLLGLLALHRGAVPRTVVSATLWPEADEQHASASLRSALWRVPGTPGLALVRTCGGNVALSDGVGVDLHGLVGDAQAMLATRRPPPSLVDAAEALRCFGYDLLTGWYDDWVIAERERFRQLRLHALDLIGRTLLAERRVGEALQVAVALVEAEPLRESGQRLLLGVHLQEGNFGEAIRQYEHFASLLHRELGVRPSDLMTGQLRRYRANSSADSAPVTWHSDPGLGAALMQSESGNGSRASVGRVQAL